MTAMIDGHVVMVDRNAFMHQAYNALYGGGVHEMPPAVQLRIVEEVTRDLCGILRNVSPDPVDGRRILIELQERLISATRAN